MSALRSATPSCSVCCQRAERSLSATDRFFDSVSSPISSWICSGLRCALCSDARPATIWSVTASTSLTSERRASRSAWPTTCSRRNRTSSGKPDSASNSGRSSTMLCQRTAEDTANIGALIPACFRWSRSISRDPPPLRIDVGLGEHAGHVRAHPDGLLDELQLGRGVLLGGVGHQEHGVRRRQRGHGRRAVHRVEAAHAGGVDDLQPAGQHRASGCPTSTWLNRSPGAAAAATCRAISRDRHVPVLDPRPECRVRGLRRPHQGDRRNARRAGRPWAPGWPRRRAPGRPARRPGSPPGSSCPA